MLTMTASATGSANLTGLILYPNGIRNGTGDHDIWLGSGIVDTVTIDVGAAGHADGVVLTVYDGLVAATQRVIRGGTNDDRLCVNSFSANATTTGTKGPTGAVLVDPYATGTTIHTDISGLVATWGPVQCSVSMAGAGGPSQLYINQICAAGMVVQLTFPATLTNLIRVAVNYTPWTAGALRKRQKTYAAGPVL